MYSVVQKAQNRTLAGDVELFARSLQTLLTVTLRFPTLAPEITSDFSFKVNKLTITSDKNKEGGREEK